jgi:hypothetical protein
VLVVFIPSEKRSINCATASNCTCKGDAATSGLNAKRARGRTPLLALASLYLARDAAQALNSAKSANSTTSSPAVIAVPAPATGVPAPAPETTGGQKAR